ncbi:DUF5627 domain-containing protein [Spirosoma sp. 209]|uniref:DUF5627 domain-containing protein n=1 Tax=Spirosoma sp. 209 TaxID=1955701 RepID=UPI001F1E9C59|nr:DUF5627 domain-containing protein [Spirosoma sp. 209]
MKKLHTLLLLAGMAVFSACENQEWVFPDFKYTTVYFAYQSPVRTITLGEDLYDTSLDNARKCRIMATKGGAYTNSTDITVDIKIDNSLCDRLLFGTNGQKVLPMPANYYSLAANQIVIPKGSITGGVEVQLTDAFFADPAAIRNTYVIPVVMNQVQNADSLLRGKSTLPSPRRTVGSDWDITPKDYILYAVKYVNPWHATYLRRGKDVIAGKDGNTAISKTLVRRGRYVENSEVCNLSTRSLNQVVFSNSIKATNGTDMPFRLILNFDEASNCTITTDATDYTVKGTGRFVKKGDLKSWGNQDRDVLHLNYEVNFKDAVLTTTDTLVVRNRGVVAETFIPVYQ